jgi:hypothetical protein
MSKGNKESITFRIKGLDILHFDLSLPDKPIAEIKIFNFDINVEQRVSFEEKLVIVVTSVEILNDSRELKLGSIKVGVVFELTNFDNLIDENTKQLLLPDDIVLTFNSIGISTTRGVMYSQFKGTLLHNAFLPVIDHKQLLNLANKTK